MARAAAREAVLEASIVVEKMDVLKENRYYCYGRIEKRVQFKGINK